MKRTDVARDFGDSPKHFQSHNNHTINNNYQMSSPSSSSHVVYQKSNQYADNHRPTNAGEDMNRNKNNSERKKPEVMSSSWLEQGDTPEGSVYVSEEIRPGVVLEGYAIEIWNGVCGQSYYSQSI